MQTPRVNPRVVRYAQGEGHGIAELPIIDGRVRGTRDELAYAAYRAAENARIESICGVVESEEEVDLSLLLEELCKS